MKIVLLTFALVLASVSAHAGKSSRFAHARAPQASEIEHVHWQQVGSVGYISTIQEEHDRLWQRSLAAGNGEYGRDFTFEVKALGAVSAIESYYGLKPVMSIDTTLHQGSLQPAGLVLSTSGSYGRCGQKSICRLTVSERLICAEAKSDERPECGSGRKRLNWSYVEYAPFRF